MKSNKNKKFVVNCNNCFYYCLSNPMDYNIVGAIYDFDHKVCGLHGMAEILDPEKPLTVYRHCDDSSVKCGYLNKNFEYAIQLTLF